MASDEKGQSGSAFDKLVEAMPRIAEAVKAFPEAVQDKAFDALMTAHAGGRKETQSPESTGTTTRKPRRTSARKAAANGDGAKATRRRSTGPVTTVKDLDLNPADKTSFKDFVEEKKPTTQHDRNVVSTYYLSHTAEISPVTVNHVFTCYRDMGWALPSNLGNSLALTANRKRFLDTGDLQNIRLTPQGINRVEQELPGKPKKT